MKFRFRLDVNSYPDLSYVVEGTLTYWCQNEDARDILETKKSTTTMPTNLHAPDVAHPVWDQKLDFENVVLDSLTKLTLAVHYKGGLKRDLLGECAMTIADIDLLAPEVEWQIRDVFKADESAEKLCSLEISIDKEEVIEPDPSTSSASDSTTSSADCEEKDGDIYTKRADIPTFHCTWCPDDIRHRQVWRAPDGWCCCNCWEGYFGCPPGNGTGIFSKRKTKYMVPLKVKKRLSRKELSDEWRGRKFAVHKFKAPAKRGQDMPKRRLNHNEQSYDIRVVCKPNAVGTVAREEESRSRGWHASPPAHTLLCAKRYEVLEKIAAGNFNVVFKVRDTKINKVCCLKIDSTMTFQIAQDLLVIHRRLEFAG